MHKMLHPKIRKNECIDTWIELIRYVNLNIKKVKKEGEEYIFFLSVQRIMFVILKEKENSEKD